MASLARPGWHGLETVADAWQLEPSRISADLLRKRCLSWLSSEERAQHEALRSERLQHAYLATKALCRATLSRYTAVDPSEWRFDTTSHGKPKVAGPIEFTSLRFNLTHTTGLVICLVSRAGEVGVDVEDTSRVVDVEQVARHFFTAREAARLNGLCDASRVERFFEQWVLKEAYLKGIGKGVALGPERLTVRSDDDGRIARIRDWRFFLHRPTASHVAAAAVRRRDPAETVSVRWLPADGLFRPDAP